jgi:hypothetical protein
MTESSNWPENFMREKRDTCFNFSNGGEVGGETPFPLHIRPDLATGTHALNTILVNQKYHTMTVHNSYAGDLCTMQEKQGCEKGKLGGVVSGLHFCFVQASQSLQNCFFRRFRNVREVFELVARSSVCGGRLRCGMSFSEGAFGEFLHARNKLKHCSFERHGAETHLHFKSRKRSLR